MIAYVRGGRTIVRPLSKWAHLLSGLTINSPKGETSGIRARAGGDFSSEEGLPGWINKLDEKCWANGLAGKARESGSRLRA